MRVLQCYLRSADPAAPPSHEVHRGPRGWVDLGRSDARLWVARVRPGESVTCPAGLLVAARRRPGGRGAAGRRPGARTPARCWSGSSTPPVPPGRSSERAPAPLRESGAHADQRRDLLSAAYNDADRTIDLRRRLHRHPEIGLHLPRTQATVLEALADLPIEVTTGKSTSSVVGVLRGARPGPTYLLRGDMDALPVHEDTGLPFASEVPGAMHACGHDTHVAMLLGAARLLAERRDLLTGQVVFMVQPGEEGFHGARYMLEEGLLDVVPEAPVSGAFALHISLDAAPAERVNVRPGPMMAAADQWRMVVRGRGGHASEPHAAADPIPVAAEIVLALQSMVTRRVDVFDPAVVTVAHIEAGSTNNVIPDSAFLEGTIRTLSADRRSRGRGRGAAGGHARRRPRTG